MTTKNKLRHLAIILDGNRRFAKKKGLPLWKGHEYGAKTVEKLFDWCKQLGIKELTLYALSTENLKRQKKEVSFLLKLIRRWFTKFKNDPGLEKDKIRIKIIGKLSLLPKNLQKLLKEIENKTKKHKKYKINFCIAYGGRLELVEAFNKLKNKKKITEKDIQKSLWLSSEPDLIIRTGNIIRSSNFLPFQSTYSEWLYLKKTWPEFTKQDLKKAKKEFAKRKRNFGR